MRKMKERKIKEKFITRRRETDKMKEWRWWACNSKERRKGIDREVGHHEEQDDSCCGKIKEAGMNENKRFADRECKEWQKLVKWDHMKIVDVVRKRWDGQRNTASVIDCAFSSPTAAPPPPTPSTSFTIFLRGRTAVQQQPFWII